jgi:hypothetical protein
MFLLKIMKKEKIFSFGFKWWYLLLLLPLLLKLCSFKKPENEKYLQLA